MGAGPQRLAADGFEDSTSDSTPHRFLLRSLVAIIVVLFALSLHRAFIANINWDEFNYLTFVHLYRSGELSRQLQTIHVHLFGWLPLVSENEIRQIFAARVLLWLLSLVSGLLLYGVARKFCSKEAALLSVLFYFGFSFVVDHGLSFRFDPICALLFLASLRLLLADERSSLQIALSAGFMALALMVSIKSVLYLGTIGTIFLALILYERNKRGVAKQALVFAAVLGVSFLLLYQVHSYALASETLIDPSALIGVAGTKTLLAAPFLPRINTVINALSQNGPIWVFVLLGLTWAVYEVAMGPERKRALILVSFSVPLLSVLFYRNAYAYFYVFLLPAVVVLGGVFADVLIRHFRRSGSMVSAVVIGGTVLMIFGSVLGDYIRKLPDQTVAQAETVALVHRMFSEPVPYIDRNSMISSYPKVGFYMSSWGMELYRENNSPVMEELIRREQPKFLIANSCALDIHGRHTFESELCPHRLLDQDFEALRANFVHHWGAIYVAGKSFEYLGPFEPQSFEILISGPYRLEAAVEVSIDGVAYGPGDSLYLDQGRHTMEALDSAAHVMLRLGSDLYKPNHEPSTQPIYVRL